MTRATMDIQSPSPPKATGSPLRWPLLLAYAVDATQLSFPQTALYLFLSGELVRVAGARKRWHK